MLQVLHLLEVVLKNPSELNSVRIQAFRSMINICPPVPTLVNLAVTMRNEMERQVGAVGYGPLIPVHAGVYRNDRSVL